MDERNSEPNIVLYLCRLYVVIMLAAESVIFYRWFIANKDVQHLAPTVYRSIMREQLASEFNVTSNNVCINLHASGKMTHTVPMLICWKLTGYVDLWFRLRY